MRNSAKTLLLGLLFVLAAFTNTPGLRSADVSSPYTAISLDSCAVELTGDVNVSGGINVADILEIVIYIFKTGLLRPCHSAGDVNCSGNVTAADIIYLVDFVFKSGSAPCDVCQFLGPGSECFIDSGVAPLLPTGIGSSWTFEVHDTTGSYSIGLDTVYWTETVIDTVVLTLTGTGSIRTISGPAYIYEWDFGGRLYFTGFESGIFLAIQSIYSRAPDTVYSFYSSDQVVSSFRTPVPMEVGQEWCDIGCNYTDPPLSRISSVDSLFMDEEFLGKAFRVERDLGGFEGYWYRTEWIVPQVGFGKISYTFAHHDGGGDNWYEDKGVFYLIDYTLIE